MFIYYHYSLSLSAARVLILDATYEKVATDLWLGRILFTGYHHILYYLQLLNHDQAYMRQRKER